MLSENYFYRFYDCDIDKRQEICYYIKSLKKLDEDDYLKLHSIISKSLTTHTDILSVKKDNEIVIEIGPKLHYQSVWSTNVKSIFENGGLSHITRIEYSTRYIFDFVN